MKVIYKHLSVKELSQDEGGQLIAEINGKKYKVVFRLDTHYASQCRVTTLVYGKDEGWHNVLTQTGTENAAVAVYWARNPVERGEWLRNGIMYYKVLAEMQKLCKMAADINS